MLVIVVQAERMAHTESKHRNNSAEENLKWFEEMLQGNYYYHYYFIYIHFMYILHTYMYLYTIYWRSPCIMDIGTPEGQAYCLRAKIDMTSLNGTMRDPVLYR